MNIDVYRGVEKIYSLPIDERSLFVKKLMNEWYIEIETISASALTFQIGDFITYDSENYTVYRLPDIEKINEKALRYTIRFESDMSLLNHKLFMWYGDELVDNEGVAEFDLNGTAEDFLDLLIKNINKTSSGWTKGTVDITTEKTMSFTNEYCLEALVRVAEEFSLEFDVTAKSISLKGAIGTETAITFQYGKGKGAYKLTRQQVQDQNILTRVYGFGSDRNIDYNYRSGLKKLIFKDGSNSYLEKNTELYGTIEGQYTNEDIYPHFEGTITSASILFDDGVFDEESYIADSSIDFDINSYLLEGTEAKIVFTSGDLSGVECVIRKFSAAEDGELPANRVYFKAYIDSEDSYTYPNYNGGTPIEPKVGDTFTFVDIRMPQAYIDTAELALKTATQTFLDENCSPQVVYTLDIDPKYAKTIADFIVGDKVTVTDTQLGVDALIRISGIEFPLVNKYKIKATIADFVPYTLQERVIKSVINERKETRFVDRRRIQSARINTIRQKQMKDMIFDADDYFTTERIKPLSIETLYLSVGTKSSDFWLQSVTIEANYGGDKNSILVSGGILNHLQISIPSLGGDWVISDDFTTDTLSDATGYYLYAKCSKSALTGEWVLSDEQITVEEVSGYYHFYCGNLFPVLDGYRKFDFVKGMTYIVGDTITSGKIQSIDENCYLDLTNAKFRVGDASSSFDWNVTTANTLTIKGALVQSPAGTTFPIKVFRGAYDPDTEYFKGDEVTYGGESWLYINETETTGTTPTEGAYWTKSAAKGATGASGATATLTVDRQVFAYDVDGANPSPSSCTLSAYAQGISGTLYYQFLVDGANKQNSTASTYVYTPKAAFADMPDIIQIFVRSGSDSGTVLAQDMITLFGIKAAADGSDGTDGLDAYTVVVSNESHTLPAANDGTVSSFSGSGTDIYVFRGITPIPYDDTGANTFSVSASPTNVTLGSAETIATYFRRYADLTAMSADSGKVEFQITIRDANSVETVMSRIQSFAKSKTGASGATATLTVDRQVFAYDVDGANPSPSSCTLSAYAQGISGTLYYQFLVDGANKQNSTASTYVYTPKAAFADMPDIIQVLVRSGSDSGTVLAQDMITLFGIKAAADGSDGTDGLDAYTVVVSNESHTLPAANDGTVSSFSGSGTDIYVFKGITPVAYGASGANTFSVSASPTNVTLDEPSTIAPYIRRYPELKAMSADSGSIEFAITARDANAVETIMTRVQSFAKSRAGTVGADGKSFENIFKRTTVETAPSTPITAQQDDYVPTGWTDDPTGVDATNRYEWVSTRTKSGSVWSDFSTPALWSRYSIDGARGRSINFRGNFNESVDYRYNDTVQDIVKYTDDVYYMYIGADDTAAAWNPSNWESFGANFESVATGLLFAEKALIENLAVNYYEGVPVGTGTLTGTAEVVTPASSGVKRKDKITLTDGAIGGVASVSCNGVFTQMFYHDDGLEATAAAFAASKASVFITNNVTVTSDGAIVYFEHTLTNTNFSMAASISYTANPYRGAVYMNGNDIWDDNMNGDEGTICVNRKGYNGGWTKYRRLYVFDGKGTYLFRVTGNSSGGAVNVDSAYFSINGANLSIGSSAIELPNIPTSDSGLTSGMLYVDTSDNTLKIVP